MQTAFDIFIRLPDGHPVWMEAVENLEQARTRLKQVARNALGDCFIYSEKNGIVELIVRSDFHAHDSSENIQHASTTG
jgi:hypothetical protein